MAGSVSDCTVCSELLLSLSCRLAAPPDPAGSPEQGDVPPVPLPGFPALRPALSGVRGRGLLGHRLGHLHRGDEAHFLRPRRRDHAAHRPARELQRKTSGLVRAQVGPHAVLGSALTSCCASPRRRECSTASAPWRATTPSACSVSGRGSASC